MATLRRFERNFYVFVYIFAAALVAVAATARQLPANVGVEAAGAEETETTSAADSTRQTSTPGERTGVDDHTTQPSPSASSQQERRHPEAEQGNSNEDAAEAGARVHAAVRAVTCFW